MGPIPVLRLTPGDGSPLHPWDHWPYRHPSQYIAALKGFGYKSSPRPSASRLSSTLESKHWTMHSNSVSSEIPGYLIYRNIPYDNGMAIFEKLSLERSRHGPGTRQATSPGIRVSGYLVNP